VSLTSFNPSRSISATITGSLSAERIAAASLRSKLARLKSPVSRSCSAARFRAALRRCSSVQSWMIPATLSGRPSTSIRSPITRMRRRSPSPRRMLVSKAKGLPCATVSSSALLTIA
jgi:hypothetical protein